MLFCGEHNNKEIEFYCTRDCQLLCTLCMWDHSDHKEKVKACIDKDVMIFVEKLEMQIDLLHTHTVDHIV